MEIQLWREILEPYSLAVDELIVKFEHMISAKRDNGQYSSIERVDGRVKKISSILAKCQKKGISFEDLKRIWMISQVSASSASLLRISMMS